MCDYDTRHLEAQAAEREDTEPGWPCLEKVGLAVWRSDRPEPVAMICEIWSCPQVGTMQEVVRTFVTNTTDPTQVYVLACGSAVI